MTTQIAVIYHSGYGHTAAQAKALAEGCASVEGVSVSLFNSEEAQANWSVLDAADAIVLGAPTYMGSVSAEFKQFMDATSSRWMTQQWKDKIAAGFTNAGHLDGDKLSSIVQLAIFAAQHGMLWVPQGLQPPGSREVGDPVVPNRMGSSLGAMAQSNRHSPTPPEGDLQTARLFGQRIAHTAQRWRKGAA